MSLDIEEGDPLAGAYWLARSYEYPAPLSCGGVGERRLTHSSEGEAVAASRGRPKVDASRQSGSGQSPGVPAGLGNIEVVTGPCLEERSDTQGRIF